MRGSPVHRPRRSLGQNFLHDENIARKIVRSLSLQHSDTVLEIGPGRGILTKHLLEESGLLIAVEIDDRLIPGLKSIAEAHAHFRLISGDFLQIDLNALIGNEDRLKVVGNIPYHITSSIIFRIFEHRKRFESMTLMIQREVAERIIAEPDNKSYGILSVFSRLYADVKILFPVSRNVFTPRPKVNSAVVEWRFFPENRYQVEDEALFIRLVKSLFNQRRKVIRNSIKTMDIGEMEIDFPMHLRPEQLSVAEFVRLANLIANGRKRP